MCPSSNASYGSLIKRKLKRGGGQNERKRRSVSVPPELGHEGKYTCHTPKTSAHTVHLFINHIYSINLKLFEQYYRCFGLGVVF